MSEDKLPKHTGKIPVYLRLKPRSANCTTERVLYVDPPGSSKVLLNNKEYTFDGIFGETTTQIDLYKSAVFPLVKNVIEGHDSLFFTMGASGSGKSFTVLGNKQIPGMIHLSVHTLFKSLKGKVAEYEEVEDMSDRKHDRTSSAIEAGLYLDWTKDNLLKPAFSSTSMYHEEIEGSSEYKYGIYISMAEVYNDKVFDLFEETGIGKRRTPLSVNTDPITRKTFLGGVTKIFVSNAQEAYRLLEKGQKLRSCHSTGSNSTSSRSHAFTCIEIKRQSANGQGDLTCSQMTIVDLAGTERNKLAKTAGNRLQESCAINQSLMLLGQCLQLQRGEEKKHNRYSKEGMNEFRSCKLTHILLSNAFLPNSTQKSAMLVTVDPFGDPNSITQIFRYSAAAQEIPEPPPTPSRISTAIKQTTPSRNPTGIKRNTPTKSVPGIRAGEITAQRTLLSVPAKSRVSSTSSNSTHSSFTLADMDRRLSEEHSDCDADDEKYDFHSSTETLLERIAILEDLLEKSEQKCQDIEDEVRLEMADEMDERMEQLKEQFLDDRDSEATRGQEHIDRKIKIAVDSIQDAERTAANSKISHLEETIEAIMRENRALKEQNEKLQSAVARGGSTMEFELHDNENGVAGMKKKKRLRTAKPVSFDDTDFSDE